MIKASNVSLVPQRSPFRYPGGKTWLVPQIRSWLRERGGHGFSLVEPFAGGGVVSLTAVMEELVSTATMLEIDKNVAAVWHSILGKNGWVLVDQVKNFNFNKKNVLGVLKSEPRNIQELAFRTLLLNRVTRNGILASGAGLLKQGETGCGLKSRWYPETIADRISEIIKHRHKIIFRREDGLQFLRRCARRKKFLFFIDPPYNKVGKRLYRYGEICHEELFEIASLLDGDFLMTSTQTREIQKLADKHGFQTKTIQMNGGLNKIKTELLIGRDLNWV